MNNTHKTTALIAALLVSGFVAPAAAQNADSQMSADTDVNAQAEEGVMEKMNQLIIEVRDLREQVEQLRAEVNQSSEAEAEVQQDSHDESPANAKAKANANTDNGLKIGILGNPFDEGEDQEQENEDRNEESREKESTSAEADATVETGDESAEADIGSEVSARAQGITP